MASHRKPGPQGTRGTGIRTPVLATAALTSVAVLSQTAGAAPASASAPTGDVGPSAEEIEKKIDELYRRADPEEEPAAVQRARAGTPRPEAARRPGLFSKAREGLVPFTAAPETATSLLADFPEDHFAQSRLMNRLASRVKGAAERGTPPAPAAAEAPAAASYDVKTAKAAVQHKLATARALLTHLTAPVTAPATAPDSAAVPAPARAAIPAPDAFSAPAPVPARPAVPARPLTPAGSSVPAPAAAPAAEQARSAAPQVSVPPVVPPAPVTKAEKAIAFARAQIGKPYVAGASGPGSYDCSGLTQAAWRAAGVALPRAARDQAAMGTTVPLAEARPGDLVFFGGDCSHAGLLTGDGTMIHAPRPGAYVREEPVHLAGEPVVHRVVRPA
ncbi:C40 family peptidase [Streptomyces sp. ATE26]|uniref:C40 family peptidase n=1 Tax=Streptomyces sp. ATE26 TaxID=2954237 RepID=UPI0024824940|nr:C40 family peptidase [Streptomyces sp. ATE26]MDI1455000.1 C40 family peptidase [Streptomyces sp. ATE26]